MNQNDIKGFSAKVMLASNKGSKEVVLSVPDALKLLNSITALQSDLLESKNEIIRLQQSLMNPTELNLDGGGF